MNALPFDTHRVVKRLKEAGFSEPQAETVTDVLREAREAELSDVATKADLAELKAELKADIALLRGEMGGEFGKVWGEFGKLRTEMQVLRTEMQVLRTEVQVEFGRLRTEMQVLRTEMQAEFGRLRGEIGDLRAETANGRTETLKWMIGLLLVQGGLIVGVLRLLPGH